MTWLAGEKVEMLSSAFSLQPLAHGGRAGVGRARFVAGGPDVAGVAGRHGHADGVVDHAAGHLVVADQSGQDGQPGGVGRGPAGRPQGVGVE